MDSLVTTEWLAGAQGTPDLRIVDANFFLPPDGRDPSADYEAGHIPGAAFLDLASLADRTTELPMMLPQAQEFAGRMTALGIGNDSRIVLYDDSPYHSSARAWWMLRLFGARQVGILDGGLAKWRAEGREVARGRQATASRADFSARPDAARVRTKAQMRANLDSRAETVVDARSAVRFAGIDPEPRPGIQPGHIPGSVNLPYGALFNADGTWKRGDDLRAAFTAAGVDPARPFVATCGSGITASVLAFGAQLLGNDAVAVYDGSWSEWGADPSVPRAIGAA